MKNCTNCGKAIADEAAFCTECGTPAQAAAQGAAQAEQGMGQVGGQGAEQNAAQGAAQAAAQSAVQTATAPAYTPPTNGGQIPPAYTPPTYTPPTYSQVPPSYSGGSTQTYAQRDDRPAADGKYGTVSTGKFFGLMFLFAIPVIGWLICLIMAFASKNENIKHYARAALIWTIIAAVIFIGLFFLVSWAGNALLKVIKDATDGMLGDWNDIFEQFNQLKSEGLGGLTDLGDIIPK